MYWSYCKQVLVSCILIKVESDHFVSSLYQNIINNHTVNSLCYWYLNIYLIAHSMEHGLSWEANRLSTSPEISHILWNLQFHYCVYKCLPPVPILSQINPVHASHPTSWRSILILSSHLCLGLRSGLQTSGCRTENLYALHLSPICATCQPISFDWSPE